MKKWIIIIDHLRKVISKIFSSLISSLGIKRYAIYLGLDPKKDRGCQLLAIQGLKTELQGNWLVA